MDRPTAVPMMPDSPSGVSMTRSSPKSFCRPSVIRKTPPSLPTSSPMISTLGSRSIARRRPSLSARPIVNVVMSARPPRHGVAGQHVIAVDPHAGEAEAVRPREQRHPGLPLGRLGDRVLVVLAEEHEWRVVDARPHERLVDVALSGRTVAEVGDHGL